MTTIAAFSAGIATSLHCVGMCGPLACAVTSKAKSRDHALLETFSYHFGRLVSYTLIGSLAGLIGRQPLAFFFHSPAAILPWLMVPFLLVTAFPNLFKVPRLQFLTRPYYKAKFWAQNKPAGIAGGLLGIISPCLPCTPLYLIFGVCLLSGSPVTGALLAFSFAMGTIPLLWAAQSSTRFITKIIPAPWRNPLRSTFLVAVTIVLLVRLQGTLPFVETSHAKEHPNNTPTPENTIKELPGCCNGQ